MGEMDELEGEALDREVFFRADVAIANVRTACRAVYEAGMDGEVIEREAERAWREYIDALRNLYVPNP